MLPLSLRTLMLWEAFAVQSLLALHTNSSGSSPFNWPFLRSFAAHTTILLLISRQFSN